MRLTALRSRAERRARPSSVGGRLCGITFQLHSKMPARRLEEYRSAGLPILTRDPAHRPRRHRGSPRSTVRRRSSVRSGTSPTAAPRPGAHQIPPEWRRAEQSSLVSSKASDDYSVQRIDAGHLESLPQSCPWRTPALGPRAAAGGLTHRNADATVRTFVEPIPLRCGGHLQRGDSGRRAFQRRPPDCPMATGSASGRRAPHGRPRPPSAAWRRAAGS